MLAQIKKAIPPHCFQRSVIKSFSFVVYDLIIIASLLYAVLVWIPALPSMQQLGAWLLYWVVQGCVMTGIWVIAHECGHHAFSDYLLLDNIVGLVLHSCLLVPYFSWKYSHRRHHANTSSLEHDEVYVPKKKGALPCLEAFNIQIVQRDVPPAANGTMNVLKAFSGINGLQMPQGLPNRGGFPERDGLPTKRQDETEKVIWDKWKEESRRKIDSNLPPL